MAQHKISVSDIAFGEPLPWDLYLASDRLLLRKGHVLVSSVQFNRLLETGLFAEIATSDATTDGDAGKVQVPETASVLRAINLADKQLSHVLHGLHVESNAQAEILKTAEVLISAVELNPDVAVAAILLNQIAGSYAVRHCIETALVSLLVAQAMKKPAQEVLVITAAALTMNVGMLRYHEQLQSKRTTLSHDEASAIQRHPEEGASLLKHAGITDALWLSYVLMHHENEDGSGYPHGKSGDEIPQNAKLISLADRYCAQVSARNYRKSVRPNIALRDIFLADDKTVDPALAPYFVQVLGSYPPGAYVRLQNGEIGIVARSGGKDCPVVRAIVSSNGQPLALPVERETDKAPFIIQEVLHEDEVGVRYSMKQIWGNHAVL